MKIYVVTNGDPERYDGSKRAFSNKEKAEEYHEWLYDSNPILEIELEDELVVKKYYKVDVICQFWNVKRMKNKVSVQIEKSCQDDVVNDDKIYYYNYENAKVREIYFFKFIPETEFNEMTTKHAYEELGLELLTKALELERQGLSKTEIEDALNKTMYFDKNKH